MSLQNPDDCVNRFPLSTWKRFPVAHAPEEVSMSTMCEYLAGGIFAVICCHALAQPPAEAYPTRPVRIITGSVGIFHDIVTRQVGHRLSERWGQPVVIENQPAAALTIGTGMAARATPDGYTLLMSDRSALAVAPHLYKRIAYDPVRDFSPITLAALTGTMLVAHPSLPANSLSEFLAYAKAQPEAVQFATAGPGTNNHIAMELFKHVTGINAIAVHYKGGAQSALGIMSGEVKVGFAALAGILPHVKAGRVKAFLITSRQRFQGAPDVPTAAESGLPGSEYEFWIGMLAPARTPPALVARLNREINEILQTPEMQKTLFAQGAKAAPGTPEAFAAFIDSESWKMKKLIDLTGMRVE
jgi:tripartite-type tricarboxylate transporter receptor subunit TctC